MSEKLHLAIIYANDNIYCEFDTQDFKKVLIEEFENTKDLDKAFENTKDRLKQVTLRI
jgi:hypothetical protein